MMQISVKQLTSTRGKIVTAMNLLLGSPAGGSLSVPTDVQGVSIKVERPFISLETCSYIISLQQLVDNRTISLVHDIKVEFDNIQQNDLEDGEVFSECVSVFYAKALEVFVSKLDTDPVLLDRAIKLKEIYIEGTFQVTPISIAAELTLHGRQVMNQGIYVFKEEHVTEGMRAAFIEISKSVLTTAVSIYPENEQFEFSL